MNEEMKDKDSCIHKKLDIITEYQCIFLIQIQFVLSQLNFM